MRYIPIDLSSDNYLQQAKIFAGYEGEHNETILQVKLPARMLDSNYSGYRLVFQTSNDDKIASPFIPASNLNNGVLSFALIEQLTIAGELLFNVIAQELDNDTVSLVSKTNMTILYIGDSPDGNNIVFNPDVYIDDILEGKVDQIYNPYSSRPQSGTAIAGALANCLSVEEEMEWIFDGGDSSSSASILFTVDNQVSDSSSNPISNSAIKGYTDRRLEEITTDLNEKSIDFITEQGVSDNGIYRKWNSGIAECWKRVEISSIARNEGLNGVFYTPRISLGNFPSGLFKEVPYVLDISLQNPEFSSFIETGALPTTKDFVGSVYLGSIIAIESMYATICVYAMGYWK